MGNIDELKKKYQEELLEKYKIKYPNRKEISILRNRHFIKELNGMLQKELENIYLSKENQDIINIINSSNEIFDFDGLYEEAINEMRELFRYANKISFKPFYKKETEKKQDITFENFTKSYVEIEKIIRFKKQLLKHFYIDDVLLFSIIKNNLANKVENVFKNDLFIESEYYVNRIYEVKHIKSAIATIATKLCSMIGKRIKEETTLDTLIGIILQNENYIDCIYFLEEKEKLLEEYKKYVKNFHNSNCEYQRKFILHIGDTNTGKTYEAIQDLKKAKSGIYLAPLRLLALEIQETLTNDNVKCSLLTGEEIYIDEGANHMSSTIEELNIENEYDVCVIDEAQLINDKRRGWAWSRALYKVKANRIHVCMSSDALDIVKKIIEYCDDEYEIIHHERFTKLEFEDTYEQSIENIQQGDAFIVFSRKSAIKTAMELEDKGIKTSVVYGSLPYVVRKNEIKKFQEKETKVIVATDAIGMGMNLPIRRIIFLETTKYDGFNTRFLSHREIKQISGRAGRRGIFDVGYVTSIRDNERIKEMLLESYTPIKQISLRYPDTIVKSGLPLSYSLQLWREFEIEDKLLCKTDVYEVIKLCEFIEDNYHLDHEITLKFATIPFVDDKPETLDTWKFLVFLYANDMLDKYVGIIDVDIHNIQLTELEIFYKQLGIISSFMRTLNHMDYYAVTMKKKNETANLLIEKIRNLKHQTKKCSKCERMIPLNHPYSVCDECYERYHKTYTLYLEEYDEDFL